MPRIFCCMIVVLGSWEIRWADGQDEPSENAPAVALPAVHGTWNRLDRPMLPNPFYAMDTAFRRPGLTDLQQHTDGDGYFSRGRS